MKDKTVEVTHEWKTKRRSEQRTRNQSACKTHNVANPTLDNAKNLLLSAVLARPKNRQYTGHFSDPPNPEHTSPNPHKRFNKEFRPYNVIHGGITPNTGAFYETN